jgi:MFS family permease
MQTRFTTIAAPAKSRSTANLALLCALWFGVQVTWAAVLAISLQARTAELGGASALKQIGVIMAAGGFVAGITQLIVAPLSDRLRCAGDNRMRFYIVGSLCGSGALVLLYGARSIPQLLGAFIGLQVAVNIALAPYQAILPDTVPAARLGVASGWMAATQSAGNAVGATLATAIGARPLLGTVLAAVLCSTSLVTVLHLARIPLQPLVERRRSVLSRAFAHLFISRALVWLGFYTLQTYLYFYVLGVLPPHFPLNATASTGLSVLIFTVVGAAGAGVAAKPSDRIDERLVVTIGAGAVACALVLLAATAALRSVVLLAVSIVAAGVGWGVFLCADWTFACRVVPPRSLATAMAVWNLALIGAQMLAPAAATALLAATGTSGTPLGPRIVLALASFEMTGGALWIWRVSRP